MLRDSGMAVDRVGNDVQAICVPTKSSRGEETTTQYSSLLVHGVSKSIHSPKRESNLSQWVHF